MVSSWWERIDQHLDAAKERGPEMVPISAPPCSTCENFSPCVQRDRDGDVSGVVLCQADAMYPDFSCFEDREGALREEESRS